MKKQLIYKDEKSDKFWNIEVKGKSFIVAFGKTGTNGQSQEKKFDSEEKCRKEADRLVAEKLKKGYREPGRPGKKDAPGQSANTASSAKKAGPGSGHSGIMDEFKAWLKKQDEFAAGYFELTDELDAAGLFETEKEKALFEKIARPFARTGDGSLIALVDRGGGLPQAVVYLDSEGGWQTIAASPEEFLLLLGRGETGVNELDDEDASDRKALRGWLLKKKVKAPKVPSFDLGEYFEKNGCADKSRAQKNPAVPDLPPPPSGEGYKRLDPALRRLALFVGRRADDPEFITFVTEELKKKVPASLSWTNNDDWIDAEKKHGFDILLSNHVLHNAYPEIPRSRTSFIPYVSGVFFRDGYRGPLPFGVNTGMTGSDLEAILGAPESMGEEDEYRNWAVPIDTGRGIVFHAHLGSRGVQYSLRIDEARELSPPGAKKNPMQGLFVAYAISRGLFDTDCLPQYAELIRRIKNRQAAGSELIITALARGLWDRHLRPLPGLREFAYDWFHNINGRFIIKDLISVFGSREDEYSHFEPVLDDDSWANVDRAAKKLDKIFAQWAGAEGKK